MQNHYCGITLTKTQSVYDELNLWLRQSQAKFADTFCFFFIYFLGYTGNEYLGP